MVLKEITETNVGGAAEEALVLRLVNQYEKVAFVKSQKGRAEVTFLANLEAKDLNIEEEEVEGKEGDVKVNPMEICLVLDVSGSMAGSKLQNVIKTIEFLVQELRARDRLGIVTFDSDVKTLLPMTNMTGENKEVALKLAASLRAGSMTNLSGGLLQGLQLMQSKGVSPFQQGVNHFNSIMGLTKAKEEMPRNVSRLCVLLSDGLMNRGITDRKKLISVVENQLDKIKDCTLHTIGFGDDADVDLSTALAQAGNGSYFAINNVELIGGVVGDILGGLKSVVAQNVELTFSAPKDVQILKVRTKFKFKISDNVCTISIPDVYSEEKRDVLFTVSVGDKVTEIAKCKLTYLDVQNGELQTTEMSNSIVRCEAKSYQETFEQQPNREVTKHLIRYAGIELLEETKVMADAGNVEKAKGKLDGFLSSVKESLFFDDDNECEDEMIKGLYDDIAESKDLMQNVSTYKVGRSKMSNMAMSHGWQRSMGMQSRGGYKNKAKKQMVYKAMRKTQGNKAEELLEEFYQA